MRIAINLAREYLGGITSSNINLMKYLCSLDYDFVGIELTNHIHMKGPVIFRSFSPETFDHHIVNIHDLPIVDIIKKNKNLKSVEVKYRKIIKIIRKILQDTKPDVILLSGTYYIPWLISIAAKKEGIPIVLWYSGVLSRETAHYKKHEANIFSSMEKSILNNSTRIIFPSNMCWNVVEKEVTKKKINKAYVIPNPISSIFTDHCAIDSSLERRIAAVGRYTEIKNFDRFFELHKFLNKNKWEHTASFVTNKNSKIKKMPRSINVLPPMTPSGLRKFYLTQGLIICPSTFETFGNVPMEAACLGIPVLVSENMGCSEILKEAGLSRMVISFDNLEAVAERAKELCGEYILPKQLNVLKKLLDYKFIGEEIEAVLRDAVKVRK